MNIFEPIDNFLNKITMYRLVFYCLIFLLLAAFFLSLFGLLYIKPLNLFISTLVIFLACIAINTIFSLIFKAPSNRESVYITAFILALIVSPATSSSGFPLLIIISGLAIASKYLLAIGKKHLFNPAAIAVVITGLTLGRYASWWIGSLYMVPWVVITGFLITRKIKRSNLVISFLTVALIITGLYSFFNGQDIYFILKEELFYTPLLFFAFIMLTEPITTPPTKRLQIIYGAMVGVLFLPFVRIGAIAFSPELALVIGNVFSYLVSPKQKLLLTLKEKMRIANDTHDFIFTSSKAMKFLPGQYMEWTLAHLKQDNRGIRRYFTIASSPTEKDIRIGVKFYEKPSSYKKTLDGLKIGDGVVASQLAGDFTLPKDIHKKLVFLAGGIGVTPFRSMVKYLLDTREKRDIIIFYAAKNFKDIAYKEVFNQAEIVLGIKTLYILGDTSDVPVGMNAKSGFITQEMIKDHIPDYQDRMFYISGPKNMIDTFTNILKKMDVSKRHIKTDFFPGFA